MILGLIIFIIGALYMGSTLLSLLGGVAVTDVIVNVLYAAFNMTLGIIVYMRTNSSLSSQTFAQRIGAVNNINAYPIEGSRLPIAIKCAILLSPKKIYFDFVDPLDPDLAQRLDVLNYDEITAAALFVDGEIKDSMVKAVSCNGNDENKLNLGKSWQMDINSSVKSKKVFSHLILNYVSVSGEIKPLIFKIDDDLSQANNFFSDLKYFTSKYEINDMCSMKHK